MVETVKITPTLFKAQAGAFSSDYRYLRKRGTGGWFISGGITTKLNREIINPGGQNETYIFAWRFKVGSVVNKVVNEQIIDAPTLTQPNFTSQAQQVSIT